MSEIGSFIEIQLRVWEQSARKPIAELLDNHTAREWLTVMLAHELGRMEGELEQEDKHGRIEAIKQEHGVDYP